MSEYIHLKHVAKVWIKPDGFRRRKVTAKAWELNRDGDFTCWGFAPKMLNNSRGFWLGGLSSARRSVKVYVEIGPWFVVFTGELKVISGWPREALMMRIEISKRVWNEIVAFEMQLRMEHAAEPNRSTLRLPNGSILTFKQVPDFQPLKGFP